jgi:hypothetical protein
VATFVLTWDGGESGYPPDDYASDVASTSEGLSVRRRWSMGNRRYGTAPGDRVFLLRQRNARGIVAAGRLVDGQVFEASRWDDSTRSALYAWVEFETVLPVSERLTIEGLLESLPEVDWNHIFASGQRIDSPADMRLDERWAQHLDDLARPIESDVVAGQAAIPWMIKSHPGSEHVLDAYLTSIYQSFGQDVSYDFVGRTERDDGIARELIIRIDAAPDDDQAWLRLIEAQRLLLEREPFLQQQSGMSSPFRFISMTLAGSPLSWEAVRDEIERES